jgi:hypothetical protein
MRVIWQLRFMGIIFFGLSATNSLAQVKKISGTIKDKQSDEPIPFASVVLKKTGQGILTDSLGKFLLLPEKWIGNDTLEILSVGYKPVLIPLPAKQDSFFITLKMEVLPPTVEAVVKSKYNRALWFWNKVISGKPNNDRARWDNYAYEIYNKLELDLDNINKQKLGKNKLLKPLDFVLVFVDSTSEEKPFLPVYLTETLSDYFYQKDPKKAYEILKAAKVDGVDNESLVKQLGGMYQNINVYNNFIPVFDKQFISPFNDNGDRYYNFKLLDTQYLNKKRLVHLRFTPKQKGADVFTGDCWIHDSSFAIQKITLRPAADANINYIGDLTLIQEFKLINDSTWFLYKDKFVADIVPLGKNKLALKGRKTTTYKNIVLNDSSTTIALQKTKKAEQVDVAKNLLVHTDSFWTKSRHEELNKNEQTVYKVLDTLEKNPTFIRYRNTLSFLTRGTKDIGNITIGPWFYWISGNNFEGTRVRFDLSTNKGFNKHLYLHGYLGYGFKDEKYKGKIEARYLLNRSPWTYLHASYKNDFDNGQVYYDQLSTDNLFATGFRRPGIPFKFQRAEETKVEFYKETHSGLALGLTASSKQYEALENLPGKELFPAVSGSQFNSFETILRLRFAYLERIVEDGFYRVTLGSDLPIVDARFTHGWPGVLKSSYQYNKIDVSISDYLKLPPYGKLYYNIFGGKVFGTVPYQFLEIQPGNELYYYNKYAFNLMKRFEFITDKFIGFNVEHNFGNGLFRYIPLTRKLKFRQFWSAKGLIGNLSNENKQLNFVGNYPFKSLDNKMYLELGTGIDNIFKLFRLDFVWRVLPASQSKEPETARFGLFGSFKVAF